MFKYPQKYFLIIPCMAKNVFQLVKIYFFGVSLETYGSNISNVFHVAVFRCSTSKTSSGFYVQYRTKDKDKEEKNRTEQDQRANII